MSNKLIITLIAVVAVVLLGLVFFGGERTDMGVGNSVTEGEGAVGEGETTAGAIKEFEVDGSNFEFSVKEIKVKKGDTVRIVFSVADGFHDWVIDEFEAKTAQLKTGESETIEFVADETGTFEYYCSVGEHRAMGMVGKLIVEE